MARRARARARAREHEQGQEQGQGQGQQSQRRGMAWDAAHLADREAEFNRAEAVLAEDQTRVQELAAVRSGQRRRV